MNRVIIRFLPLIFIVAALVLAVLLVLSREKPQRKKAEPKLPVVEVMSVALTNPQFSVSSQGMVSPKHTTLLSGQVAGRVEWVSDMFIEGGSFNKGDVLIRLEQDDYLTDVKQAEANLARAKASLQEEQARGKVAAVEWSTIQNSVAPELGLRKPQLANEEANVKAAEANLERAERNLKRTSILAPFDGIVRVKNVEIGQFVGVGSQLGTLFDTKIAQVRLPLKQSDFAYLSLDEGDNLIKTPVLLRATVAGKEKQWSGYITRDEGLIDDASRVTFAVAEVNDPYRRNNTVGDVLKFGTFVQAEIQGKQANGVAIIPRKALRIDNTVIVVDGDNQLRSVPVEVIKSETQHVWISRGLSAEQQLVVSSLANPTDGTEVKIKTDSPAMATTSSTDIDGGAR